MAQVKQMTHMTHLNKNKVTRSFYVYRVRENYVRKLEQEGFSSDQISSLTQRTDVRDHESHWGLQRPEDPAAQECLRLAAEEIDERYTL